MPVDITPQAPAQGTRVTARALAGGEPESRVILNDYNLVTDGECYVDHIQVYGNGTHVITVKNVGGAR